MKTGTLMFARLFWPANSPSLKRRLNKKCSSSSARRAKHFLRRCGRVGTRLTADFTLTLSNGEVSTRADEINELSSGKVHYDVFENYDMLARLYGNDTAVVLGKTRVKGTADGKPFDRIVQFTDTLIKRDGRWQLAAGHVSRIEK